MLDGFRQKDDDRATAFSVALGATLEGLEGFDDADFDITRSGAERGYSGPVCAVAIRQAWLASPFVPSIHEFIKLSDDARSQFWMAERSTARMLEMRADADDF